MQRRFTLWFFALVLLAAGCQKRGISRDEALSKVRASPSALPGLSVEQAVEQVLSDMGTSVSVKRGRWYCNPAIEHDGDAYKVGYEFMQGGKTARFGWTYYLDEGRFEALTDYARQVKDD